MRIHDGIAFHGIARILVHRTVRLALAVDADELAPLREVLGDRGLRESHHCAGLILGHRKRRRVEGAVVAVVAEQLDRIVQDGPVERRAQRRELGIRLVAVRVVPLIHHEPLALGQVVFHRARVYERGQLAQGLLRAAVEIADVEIDDIERMDVRIDESRQHELALETLHRRLRSRPGRRIRRAADEHDLAVLDGERFGHRARSIGRIDARIRHHQIGRSLTLGERNAAESKKRRRGGAHG